MSEESVTVIPQGAACSNCRNAITGYFESGDVIACRVYGDMFLSCLERYGEEIRACWVRDEHAHMDDDDLEDAS